MGSNHAQNGGLRTPDRSRGPYFAFLVSVWRQQLLSSHKVRKLSKKSAMPKKSSIIFGKQSVVEYDLVSGQCDNEPLTATRQPGHFDLEQLTVTALAVSSRGQLDRGSGPGNTALLPEAQSLSWTDDFFDHEGGHDDMVAVFDFDYDAIQDFITKVASLPSATGFCARLVSSASSI